VPTFRGTPAWPRSHATRTARRVVRNGIEQATCPDRPVGAPAVEWTASARTSCAAWASCSRGRTTRAVTIRRVAPEHPRSEGGAHGRGPARQDGPDHRRHGWHRDGYGCHARGWRRPRRGHGPQPRPRPGRRRAAEGSHRQSPHRVPAGRSEHAGRGPLPRPAVHRHQRPPPRPGEQRRARSPDPPAHRGRRRVRLRRQRHRAVPAHPPAQRTPGPRSRRAGGQLDRWLTSRTTRSG
jgi:hypothetical protein